MNDEKELEPRTEIIPCYGTLVSREGGWIKSDFDIVYSPAFGPRIKLKPTNQSVHKVFSFIQPSGTFEFVSDTTNGLSANCKHLFYIQRCYENAAFTGFLFPQSQIEIGDEIDTNNIREFSCLLLNYYGDNFDLRPVGIPVYFVANPENKNAANSIPRQWRLPVETGELTILNEGSLANLHLLANRINRLLTFLEGCYVSYHQYRATDSLGRSARLLGLQQTMQPKSSFKVLHTTNIQKPLEKMASVFLEMDNARRDHLSLAITYLASAKSYDTLEQSTIDLAIAWEILRHLFSDKPIRKNKVSFRVGIENTIEQADFCKNKINADPEMFVKLRNCIIHEGTAAKIGAVGEKHLAINFGMLFAADLVILHHLGYNGDVSDRRSYTGWTDQIAMDELRLDN